MPMFEYKCDVCGRPEERYFATLAERDKHEAHGPKSCKPGASPINHKCQGRMRRQLSTSNFKVNGYCAQNGYAFNGSQAVSNKGVK